LGDRGETEDDIQQSENNITGETEITNQEEQEQEQINDEDEPPPLEDIDELENEIIEPVTDTVQIEKSKDDDIGKF